MLDGVALTLLVGPAVPVPVPRVVTDALVSVEVSTGITASGFQLTFSVGTTSPLLTTMLPAGYLDPIVTRVIIAVTVRGLPQVLMDGVVTRQELAPSNEPGRSTLTVTGEDLSILMDLVEMPFMRYPAMPEVAQLAAILAKYAVFGIVPVLVPPVILDRDLGTVACEGHVADSAQAKCDRNLARHDADDRDWNGVRRDAMVIAGKQRHLLRIPGGSLGRHERIEAMHLQRLPTKRQTRAGRLAARVLRDLGDELFSERRWRRRRLGRAARCQDPC